MKPKDLGLLWGVLRSHTAFWKISEILHYTFRIPIGGCPFMFQDLKRAQKSPFHAHGPTAQSAWMVPDPESLPYAVPVWGMYLTGAGSYYSLYTPLNLPWTPPQRRGKAHRAPVLLSFFCMAGWIHPGFPKMQSVQVAFLSALSTPPHLTTYGMRRTWSEVGFFSTVLRASQWRWRAG